MIQAKTVELKERENDLEAARKEFDSYKVKLSITLNFM